MDTPAYIVMFFLIFGGGSMLTKMWSSYNNTRIEIARIKSEKQSSGANNRDVDQLRAELESTRKELQSLRDTSTQYDISFDTALSRIESRVTHVERKVGVSNAAEQPETITLTGR